jgi:arylsulfatase A-like enzyme
MPSVVLWVVLAILATAACGDGPMRVETIDLIADGGLLADDARLVPRERFAADETWVAVAMPTGHRVTAKVELRRGPVLDLTGALKCSAESPVLAAGELIVEVAGSRGAQLESRIPLDQSTGWWRHQVDLSRLDGRQVTVDLESGVPAECSLLLREVTIRQRIPLEHPAEDPPVQILLISVDTLRKDAIDPPASGVSTPQFDEFALEAERFSPHYAAASWTKPSHASLLTGFHPDTHRSLHLNQGMDPAIPTLAERFMAGGLKTAALVYDCGWLSPKWGFAKGFDSYRMTRWRVGRQASAAARWVVDHRDEPFFFFVHTFEPHSDSRVLPYEAPGVNRRTIAKDFGVRGFGLRDGFSASRFVVALDKGVIPRQLKDVEILRDTYEASVRYVDEGIGVLFDALKSSGVWDQMLIVVTSDHGEEFDEHGGFAHGSLYEEIIGVPLFIKWPNSERAGQTRPGLSSSIDLAPTLLRHAGLAVDDLPGVVLGHRPADDPVFSGTLARTVIAGEVKGIFGGPDDLSEIYDLAVDPGELVDLAARDGDQVRMLRELLRLHHQRSVALYRRYGAEPADREVVLSESERERLRAFGYIQ